MIVSDLIEFLQTQPQHLTVLYRLCSEQTMLESKEIVIEELCLTRPDGWVQNKRPDKPTQTYLVFPGN